MPEIDGNSSKTISIDNVPMFKLAQIIDTTGASPYHISNMWWDINESSEYLIISNCSASTKTARKVRVYYIY